MTAGLPNITEAEKMMKKKSHFRKKIRENSMLSAMKLTNFASLNPKNL